MVDPASTLSSVTVLSSGLQGSHHGDKSAQTWAAVRLTQSDIVMSREERGGGEGAVAADAHVLPEVDQPLLRWGDTLLLLELLLDLLCLSSMHGRKGQYRWARVCLGRQGRGSKKRKERG